MIMLLLKYFILEMFLAEDNHLAMVISEIVTLENIWSEIKAVTEN